MTMTSPMTTANDEGTIQWPRLDPRDTERYGVFVRPDPVTCRAQIELHTLVERQFGLLAGRVFPPHATLLGNIAITAGENDLLARVEALAGDHAPFTACNKGLERSRMGIGYDVDHLSDGSVNQRFTRLAQTVEKALRPVRGRTDADYLTGQTGVDGFHAHLTVVGQDYRLRPDLQDEVWDFCRALAPRVPEEFPVDSVSVFRFRSDHWASEWWKDMTWQHLRTVPLRG
jgi:2'-5' RNA ligase superfamily